jgi:hypothetical protein
MQASHCSNVCQGNFAPASNAGAIFRVVTKQSQPPNDFFLGQALTAIIRKLFRSSKIRFAIAEVQLRWKRKIMEERLSPDVAITRRSAVSGRVFDIKLFWPLSRNLIEPAKLREKLYANFNRRSDLRSPPRAPSPQGMLPKYPLVLTLV